MIISYRLDYKRRMNELRGLILIRRERPLTIQHLPEAQFPGSSEVLGMRTAVDFLHDQGWQTHHETDSRRTNGGFPDLVAVKPPHVIFFEFKVGGKKLDPLQRNWRDDLEQCPGVVYAQIWLDDPVSWRFFLSLAMGDPVP